MTDQRPLRRINFGTAKLPGIAWQRSHDECDRRSGSSTNECHVARGYRPYPPPADASNRPRHQPMPRASAAAWHDAGEKLVASDRSSSAPHSHV